MTCSWFHAKFVIKVGLEFRDHGSQLNLLSTSSTIFCACQTTTVADGAIMSSTLKIYSDKVESVQGRMMQVLGESGNHIT